MDSKIPISFTGRVTADLEPQKSKNGTNYLKFNVAVNRGYEEKQKPVFMPCVLFGEKQIQRMVNAKVKKGSLIFIVGDFDVEEYEKKDGTKGTANKITLYDWNYVSSGKPKNETSESQEQDDTGNNEDINEDDLPL